MSDLLKVGFVGCGRMATCHAGALKRVGGVEIVGVYDIDMPKAEKFAKEFEARRVCRSRAELLDTCGVELLLICDYGHQHANELHAAMDAGIRSIFCEKPVIRHVSEAAPLLKKQKETGSLIAVGHVRRFYPQQLKMKEILDSGILGRIHFCRIHSCVASFCRDRSDYFGDYARSGGCTLDMATHFIDMLNWYFGAPSTAVGSNIGMEKTLLPEELPCDYVSGYVKYPGNIVCGLDVSYQRHGISGTTMEIYGEKATMVCVGGGVTVVSNDFKTEYTVPDDDACKMQMAFMVRMTRERIEPPCGLKEGILASATALAIMDPKTEKVDFRRGF